MSGQCVRCHQEPPLFRLHVFTAEELRTASLPRPEESYALGEGCLRMFQDWLTTSGPATARIVVPKDFKVVP